MKLILAWLEANYARRVGEPSMEAKDIAWEHTLDTLKVSLSFGRLFIGQRQKLHLPNMCTEKRRSGKEKRSLSHVN